MARRTGQKLYAINLSMRGHKNTGNEQTEGRMARGKQVYPPLPRSSQGYKKQRDCLVKN